MKTPGKIRSRERIHKDPQIEDTAHDPYRERHKPKGAAFCPTCGAIFEQGRWQWMAYSPSTVGTFVGRVDQNHNQSVAMVNCAISPKSLKHISP